MSDVAIGTLSALLQLDDEGNPPTKFRVFGAGMNTSLEGEFLFDEQAASDVMAAFKRHAVDGMIDLEHLSLDDKNPNYDPDARGAYKDLEIIDGELWAASASWTPDGTKRLKEKTQRYVSPTFAYDKTTRRVKWLFNIALTSNPSLDGIPALVAARSDLFAALAANGSSKGDTKVDPKQIEAVMKAAGLDPKMMSKVAVALGLEAGADADAVKGAIDALAAKKKKIEDLLGDAKEEPSTPGAATETPAAEPPPVAAASASNEKLLAAVESLSARIARQEAEAADKAQAEERASLVASRKWPAELLEWAGDKSTPIAEVKRLSAKFPLVTALSTAADATAGGTRGAAQGSDLDERELRICKDTGCAPETFAALKAKRDGKV